MDYQGGRAPSSGVVSSEPAGRRKDSDDVRAGLQSLHRDPSQLEIHFQPIVATRGGQVVGVEALSRFPDGRPPDLWFSEAADLGLGIALELLAVGRALAEATPLPSEIYLAVNVSPATVVDQRLRDVVESAGGDLVLELTEHAPVEDYGHLRAEIKHLHSAGIRVAADDAGHGYSGLAHILNLRPDCIKLDRELVRDIDVEPAKKALASAFIDFAREIDAFVIAGGVETEAELEVLVEAGIRFVQGYLFGPPAPLSASLSGAFNVQSTPRVLVIDDDAVVRAVVRLTLEKSGFEVVAEADEGAAAVNLARSSEPDVIILDVAMPGMDGNEAFPLLRAAAPGAAVVVLSGSAPSPSLRRLADGYLPKDHAVKGLAALIRDMVRGRRRTA